MNPETLAGELERFQVVDVRFPNEWDAGHIDGALHIPLDHLYERTGEPRRLAVCRSAS